VLLSSAYNRAMRPNLRLLFLLLLMLLAACAPQKTSDCPQGPFAIYLTAVPMNGAEILRADLEKVALESAPVIAADEIISYTMQAHELRLAPEAVKRLFDMKVPVNGVGFVACADGKALLGGAFWADYSSLSYDGVTIMKPLDEKDPGTRFVWGYPGPPINLKDNPLSDPKFLQALDREGKLK
jgi:hypothetical protein